MAESGGVSGILGAGGESPAEGSTPETQTPLDPTAAALAAEVAKNNPELAQEASAYFRKQRDLVEVGVKTLKLHRCGMAHDRNAILPFGTDPYIVGSYPEVSPADAREVSLILVRQ
jgi:hypothetical protein